MPPVEIAAPAPPAQRAEEKAAAVKSEVASANSIAALRTQVENLTDAVLALTEELRRRG